MLFHENMHLLYPNAYFICNKNYVGSLHGVAYLLHFLTQSKPKQLKLVSLGAVYTFQINQ